MRTGTKYDEVNVMEKVILPMANLKFSLEAILREEQEISTGDLLRGLRLVHMNASAILQELSDEEVVPVPELPERRTSKVLRAFAVDRNEVDGRLESVV